MRRRSLVLVNLADWERAAAAVLSDPARDYFTEGAMDGRTLADNETAFTRRRLRPRVLAGHGRPDTTVEVLGRQWPHPIFLAPTARHVLAHPDGEVATARGLAGRGTPRTVSTSSSRGLDEIVAGLDTPWWYQVYVLADRVARRALVEAAVDAGAEALVLTVDVPTAGRRERPLRQGRAAFPTDVETPHVAAAAAVAGLPTDARLPYKERLGPDDVTWLTTFGLPVVVKGVLRSDDARRAVDAGAACIQVSNHGGRQLDGTVASLDALEEVVDTVGDRVPVLLDGGVRRGTDAAVALALGATAVGIGKPILWGLAVDGADGVGAVVHLLVDEVAHAMRQLGAADRADLTRDLVTP